MTNMQIIGQKIRQHRKMKSMTQKELAAELGVASSYIANIEQGQKGISLDKLVEFCKYLNIELSDLLPIGVQGNSAVKEEIIQETVDLLRGLDTTQVQMVRTMVAGVVGGG
jgi:transcriptional regulator with XRE-family HTH domain